MNSDEIAAEPVAQAWTAAEASEAVTSKASPGKYPALDTRQATFEVAAIPPYSDEPTSPSTQQQQLSASDAPLRRKLTTYVSEPPSTLLALSVMAQEEEKKKAAAAFNLSPSPFDQNSNASSGVTESSKPNPIARDMAWMHASPDDIKTVGKSHKSTDAGDLAGAELRQRRPVAGMFRAAAVAAIASSAAPTSPARKPANSKPVAPRLLNHMRSMRPRDAGALVESEESDDEDDLKKDKDNSDHEVSYWDRLNK